MMGDVGQTDDRQYFVDAASRNRVGVREPEQMVARTTTGVSCICVEQCAYFLQREAQLSVAATVDVDLQRKECRAR